MLPPAVRGRLEALAEPPGAGWDDARKPGRRVRRFLRARVPWPEGGGADMPPAPSALLALPAGGLPVHLGLAAAWAARALPGLRPWGGASATGRDWLAHGGLEGCLYGAGLRCLSRRTLLGGAALLARCEGLPRWDGPPGAAYQRNFANYSGGALEQSHIENMDCSGSRESDYLQPNTRKNHAFSVV